MPSRLVQSAIDSVSATKTQYTTDLINLSVEYGVLVWAYNHLGDGLPAKAEWTPECKILWIYMLSGEEGGGSERRERGRVRGREERRERKGGSGSRHFSPLSSRTMDCCYLTHSGGLPFSCVSLSFLNVSLHVSIEGKMLCTRGKITHSTTLVITLTSNC